MSKTIDLQIEKSRTLIDGLRKNLTELADKSISAEVLAEMDTQLQALAEANAECDALRAQLSQRVKNMNGILTQVKEAYAEKKKTIKGYYPQEEWSRLGVMDKR